MSVKVTAFDYAMFQGEGDPRTRSGGAGVMILDRSPDFQRVLRTYERASRLIPRLRQRIVTPSVGLIGSPVWANDPDFDIRYHVRRTQMPAPGSMAQLLEFLRVEALEALDPSRPQWQLTLIEGLEGGQCALMQKASHVISDGLGAIQMQSIICDAKRDDPEPPMPPLPIPEDVSPAELTREAVSKLPSAVIDTVSGTLGAALSFGRTLAKDAGGLVSEAERQIRLIRESVGSISTLEPSPLLRGRSGSRRFHVWETKLDDLKKSAKATGGSVNDVYLAAIAGGLRRYHETLGSPIDEIPFACPVSVRKATDAVAGNHFAGATFSCPVGLLDPYERVAAIHDLMLAGRELAVNLPIESLISVASMLPINLANLARLNPVDVQASNVPGPPVRGFIAGAEIVKSLGFGPLPGCGMMIILMSYAGECPITAVVDSAAFSDAKALDDCMQAGIDEMVEVGRKPAPNGAKKVEKASLRSHRLPTEPASKNVVAEIQEIDHGPVGPEVAAFFDLDGTMVAGYSASFFTEDQIRRGELSINGLLKSFQQRLSFRLGRSEFAELITVMAEVWKGRTDDDVREIGERVFVRRIADRIHDEARQLVAAHRRKGHTIVLCSSASQYQVEPLAAALGIEHVICTELEVEDGMLTGKLASDPPWGEAKARRAQELVADLGVDLAKSTFYADGDEDLAFMHLVGRPRPVNPGPRLESVAGRRGWPVLTFESQEARGGVGIIARNVAAQATLAYTGAAGLALNVLTGRREPTDWMGTLGMDLVSNMLGIKVNVIGEQHLKARPSMFIFNHRNKAEVIVVGKLTRGGVVGVGKKELEEQNPLMAWVAKRSGNVFIDRSDTAKAVEAMEPLRQRVKEGLSLMIAPEGTRSTTGGLGPFKKGAFRMAMACEIPIVPIVIRNADAIAGRDELLFRPAVVDVIVMPPISVADWTLENLDDRIAVVRDLYLDALADWPTAVAKYS